MEYFHSIKDSDIFENPDKEPTEYVTRPTVKGLVFDMEGKIALLYTNKGYGLFPGGGVEEGESLEGAFIRECEEEIGSNVEILYPLGTAAQFRARDSRKFETHFFVAKTIGEKGIPTTTQEEEVGVKIEWLAPGELGKRLEEQINTIPKEYYQSQFNSRTHLAGFREYLKKIN